MGKNKIYFESLNGLRFIAASLVVFHHVSQYKDWAGLPSIWGDESNLFIFVDALGNKSVSLFFVLSGFLITFLLLKELESTSTVALKKFYIRRILRIWPLYFTIILIALLLLPILNFFIEKDAVVQEHFWTTITLHLLILPNLLMATPVIVPGANQAWSIGVEEQFYIIWPILIRWFNNNIPVFLIAFIFLKLGFGWIGELSMSYTEGTLHTLLDKFTTIWHKMMFEQMAVGALGAWVLFSNNEKVLKFIFSKPVQWITILCTVLLFITERERYFSTVIEGVVFTSLIMNLSLNKRFPVKLKSKKYDILGNLSYGIYMWHTIIITIVLSLANYTNMINTPLNNLFIFIVPYLLTLVISYLSYKYFESGFLKLKKRFMVVKSSVNKAEK